MAGHQLRFYGTTGSGGTADGDSQPSPAAWLGRFRASQTLHTLQSTFTSAGISTARHIVRDTARIGDGANAHDHRWLLVQTGPAALTGARVEFFNNATGDFELDRPLPANVAVADNYALFAVNNVWPDVTAAQAAAGDTRYRCVFVRNEHGVSITNPRVHLEPLGASGFDLSRINQVAIAAPFIQRSDDVTDIVDVVGQPVPLGGPDGFDGASNWLRPFARAHAADDGASITNNNGWAIWLRRTIPAGVRKRASVATLVVLSTDITGSSPDPLIGGAIVAWDLETDPTVTLAQDRYTHVGGGARFTARVLSGVTPIVNKAVRWVLSGGFPGSVATGNDPTTGYSRTDAAGDASATVTVLTSATAGGTGSVTVQVGDGAEVPNP